MTATKHRAASLQQQSYLYVYSSGWKTYRLTFNDINTISYRFKIVALFNYKKGQKVKGQGDYSAHKSSIISRWA